MVLCVWMGPSVPSTGIVVESLCVLLDVFFFFFLFVPRQLLRWFEGQQMAPEFLSGGPGGNQGLSACIWPWKLPGDLWSMPQIMEIFQSGHLVLGDSSQLKGPGCK
jgi:hypothetical protein